MNLILVILTCLMLLITITNAARNRGYNSNWPSRRQGLDFPIWPWQEEDFIVDNWRRKCSKYNIVNSVKNYITGGLKAQMDMFPYLVGLLMYQPPRIYQCGGSLITERYVLTAAHCLYRSTEGRVFLGSYVYANEETAASVYNVTTRDFILHEQYGRQGFKDDIALINLQRPATLSEKVQLVPLAPSYMTQTFLQGELVTSAGWGRIRDNDTQFNRQLYYVDTRIIGYEKCMCYYLPGLVNSRSHVCADGTGGRGGCDGDSGGPVVLPHKNKYYLIGVTAFGSAGGCQIGFPTVYTRITYYLRWISRKTGIKVQ